MLVKLPKGTVDNYRQQFVLEGVTPTSDVIQKLLCASGVLGKNLTTATKPSILSFNSNK